MANEDAIKQAEEILEKQKNNKTEETTKEQVYTAALGFYLPQIMKQGLSIPTNSENVIRITDREDLARKQLPSYSNILTKKENNVKICELGIFKSLQENSLFLSEAVPYVKLYKTISKNGKKIDINLPFDIVAGQKYGDKETLEQKILQGGSGGSVGIASFDWKSEGKNEGNNSLYTVNFKIVLQDASELKKTRNIVGDQKVAILDLLYYGFLNNEKDSKKKQEDNKLQTVSTNETDYMEFKAELGFNFSEIYSQYNDYFKTNLNLRVYKHNFNFDQSGKVELEIIAIGNIESDFSNKVRHNILEREEVRVLKRATEFIKNLKSMTDTKAMAIAMENLQQSDSRVYDEVSVLFSTKREEDTKSSETVDTAEATTVVTTGVAGVVGTAGVLGAGKAGAAVGAVAGSVVPGIGTAVGIALGSLGATLIVGAIYGIIYWNNYFNNSDFEQVQKELDVALILVKQALVIEKVNIVNGTIQKLKQKQKIRYFALDYNNFQNLKTFISLQEVTNLDGKILKEILPQETPTVKTVDKNETANFLVQEKDVDWFTFTPESAAGEIVITPNEPLSQIKEEINKDKDDDKQTEIISFIFLGDLIQGFIDENDLIKKETNIFLGPFSFYNYQKSFNNLQASLQNNSAQNNKQNKFMIQGLEKEIGSLYNVPISISTLQKWFKDLIESKEELSYSFNRFLKFCMSDLIKQNIATKTAPASPYNTVSINPYYFSVEKSNMDNIDSTQNISIRDLSKIYSKREVNNYSLSEIKKNIAFISVAEYSLDPQSFTGNFANDCENNILHLFVNSMSSIVKNISFSRDDDARLETANLQAANDANPNKMIRQVYHANINMFGNCIFEPGNLLYIKANYPGVPLSDSTLEEIGLGGYYRITNVDNSITSSGFATSLKCIWEMSSDGTKSVYGNRQQGIKVTVVNNNAQN
jgi:outer membrane lipoprotein SlyB